MVIETLLVKEAGLDLADLRGETVHETHEEPRTGVLAWVRSKLPGMDRGTVTRHVSRETPGMTEREVLQRWLLHNEHERMIEEEEKKAANKAESQARTQ